MKIIILLFIFGSVSALAQEADIEIEFIEKISIDSGFHEAVPVDGYNSLRQKLETTLSGADTVGKKYSLRLNNIGFIVSEAGKIDSAWVIYHRRPIHFEIIKQLKTTKWKAARQDGVPVSSFQQLYFDIHLTKRVLKKHGYWPSLVERLLAPWQD